MTSGTIRNEILNTLADGAFHSGEQLAASLGVSRAAVSNHVKALQQLGLDIFSVTGKGYRLATALTLLNAETIHREVGGHVDVLNVIHSTNQYVREQSENLETGAVCLAEAQTAGRGRHGRKWHSPFGANLYLSMYWHFDGGYQALDGLSLVVGLAVAKALETTFDGRSAGGLLYSPQLKWPNDIYCDGRKLGGILIEVDGQFGGACQTVIGVGLNVAMPQQNDIDQPWTDLSEMLSHNGDIHIDRNTLSVALIRSLREQLMKFEAKGFSAFVDEWQARHIYQNKPVRLINGKHTQHGTCRGIDQRGGLLLESDGNIKAFYGGEISVRPD